MWMTKAQHHNLPEVIWVFNKCCLSNAMDGTDDDTLWNGSGEDGDVRRQCGAVEGTNCEDGDSDIDW